MKKIEKIEQLAKELDIDNPIVYIDDDGYEEFLEDNEIYTVSGQDGITKAFAIVVNKDGKFLRKQGCGCRDSNGDGCANGSYDKCQFMSIAFAGELVKQQTAKERRQQAQQAQQTRDETRKRKREEDIVNDRLKMRKRQKNTLK